MTMTISPRNGRMGCLMSCRKRRQTKDRFLFAFDFDHTILDDNSDTAVTDLLLSPVPEEVTRVYSGRNWTQYMDRVMKYIASEGVKPSQIYKKIQELKVVPGMDSLLTRISKYREKHIGTHLIIVSDANSFFIDAFLHTFDPKLEPDKIITNEALLPKGSEGYLQIIPYENQTACPICPPNLCKGKALEDYIKAEGPFGRVFYTGDGHNDLCPSLRLRENDIVFVRRGYGLHALLNAGHTKQNVPIVIQAQVILFKDASTLHENMPFE